LTLQEEFEDTKEVIKISKSKKNRQHSGQKKKYKGTKQHSTKHTHKKRSSNTNPTKTRGWTQVLRKG